MARPNLSGQEAPVSAPRTWVNTEGSSRYPLLAHPVNGKSESGTKTLPDGPSHYRLQLCICSSEALARHDVFNKATVISSLETYVEGWGGVLRAR